MSHRLRDDPIVAPGRPGAAHGHDFFGNHGTNAFSTYDSLIGQPSLPSPTPGYDSPTSCNPREDTAAYWTPTLFADGRPLGGVVRTYYKAGGKDPAKIRAFPPGLKMVAGTDQAERQKRRIVSWRCAGPYHSPAPSEEVLACLSGLPVLRVEFPDCWNGRTLDGAGHYKHMAYAEDHRGRRYRPCPASHPVRMPALAVTVTYYSTKSRDVTLTSGPPRTAHADFFNAWRQDVLERLVHTCVNTAKRCRPY